MFEEVSSHRVFGLRFGLYTSNEIRKISVMEVTNPHTFDMLMHPATGGLYDPMLGPSEKSDVCGSCGQSSLHCPGHLGHISLPLTVYNPVLFQILLKILRGVCFQCQRLVVRRSDRCLLQYQMLMLSRGYVSGVQQLRERVNQLTIEQCVTNKDLIVDLEEELKNTAERLIAENSDGSACKSCVRSVQDARQALLKIFLRGNYYNKRGCPHCKMPLRAIRTEYNTKIYLCKGVTKKQAKKVESYQHKRKALDRKKSSGNPQLIVKIDYDDDDDDEEDSDVEQIELDDEEVEDQKKLQAKLGGLTDQQYIMPSEVRNTMRALWQLDGQFLESMLQGLQCLQGHANDSLGCDVFFMDCVPVPPAKFRPFNVVNEMRHENAQTANLVKVMQASIEIRKLLYDMKVKKRADDGLPEDIMEIITLHDDDTQSVDKLTVTEQLNALWLKLQTLVNRVMDSELDKLNIEKVPGIRQLLEKKEGLFRKHMMGKRVNYAARSVISPDPCISTNEVGIPQVFALKLTFPEPVNPLNFHQLRQAVLNGPDIHPGACYVENEDGTLTLLRSDNKTQRESIAKSLLTSSFEGRENLRGKKVYRHIRTGDMVLLNRQPTLHRPSIQAHKVRVLPSQKTLRLHYSACKAYNADFDGDEMNVHFPQTYVGQAEAKTLAAIDFHYLVPKDGTPLGGLIQDHIVSGVALTMRGRLFSKQHYQQLVYSGLVDTPQRVKLLPPCLLRPTPLWSGKQVFSTLLINLIPAGKAALNLDGKSKISGKSWSQGRPTAWHAGGTPLVGDDMGESQVIIRQGELLVGVLDKAHYGATPYSLVHCCYEVYGGQMVSQLLTALARLFTAFLQLRGFTLGVEDILCTRRADRKRRRIMKKGQAVGPAVAAKAFNVALGQHDEVDEGDMKWRFEHAHLQEQDKLKDMDLAMKQATDEIQAQIVRSIMPEGLLKRFPHNNLQLLVQSGAKGSTVNCMQISCLLGQIELEGRRPPLMMSGQFLPSFEPYDLSPRAGGFVDGRFLTGIRPQEYFFHCMAGREGLIDTAVKTSRSGYLQRCIVKHLEGLVVSYDMTVRDSDGSVIQFQYGEDGLDVTKIQFLNQQQFPFMIQNHKALSGTKNKMKDKLNTDTVEKTKLKMQKWLAKRGLDKPEVRAATKDGSFVQYCRKHEDRLLEELGDTAYDVVQGRTLLSRKLCHEWLKLDRRTQHKYVRHKCPDPVTSTLPSHSHLGAIAEKLEFTIENYIRKNPHHLIKDFGATHRHQISADRFRSLIYQRNMESLVHPGEGVGLLAAQSIGEPSTQMTLNTFHFAGRGEMNVTLGIPRLREILMTGSWSIKTPAMMIPVKDTPEAYEEALKLKKTLNRVYLSEVLQNITVNESIYISENINESTRRYCVRFNFLPESTYKDRLCVTAPFLLEFMEKKFLKAFQEIIRRKINEISKIKLLSSAKLRSLVPRFKATPKDDEDLDESDDVDDEDGAAAEREIQRHLQERDYQGEEEEEGLVKKEELSEDEDLEDVVSFLDNTQGEVSDSGDETSDSGPDSSGPTVAKTSKKKAKKMARDRLDAITVAVTMGIDYQYDYENEQWCQITYQCPLLDKKLDMTSLLEREVKKTVVYQVRNINRALVTDPKPGQRAVLRTEGVNIMEMYKYYDILDLDELYTNDIHQMDKTYGIEAATQSIVKEMRDVFSVYGIDVAYHHLSLVADYMTFEGRYSAFNRSGLESNPSPLQKMTFEASMQFLKKATVQGELDELRSPSARLIVGRVVGGGTGSFDIVVPTNCKPTVQKITTR